MGQSASKEKFRESVTALLQVDVQDDDAEFWDELWKIPSSAEEVFELLSPNKVRQLRDDKFDNMITLFTQAVAQLCQIVETPYNIYFDQALNCVRVLTRILPFILEKGDLGDADEHVEQLCWGTGGSFNPSSNNSNGIDDTKIGLVVGSTNSNSSSKNNNNNNNNSTNTNTNTNSINAKQNAAANSLAEKLNKSGTFNNNNNQNNQNNMSGPTVIPDDQEPLALLIVHAAMHMLFLPQFTCDFYEDSPIVSSTKSNNSNSNSNNKKQQSNNNSNTGAVGLVAGAISTTFGKGNNSNNNNNNKQQQQNQIQQQQNLSNNNNNYNKKETRDDREIKAEAGLLIKKQIEWGISLQPVPLSIIWSTGVGVTVHDMGFDANTRKYDKNRVEVLRLLLTSFCDPLYSPADEYNPLASRWLAVATAADAPNSICLFYSLLNTILHYDPRAIPVATGFSEGNHIKLVELSVQVLCLLLDCGLPGNPEPIIDQRLIPCVEFKIASKGGFNIFRTLLARLDSSKDLSYVYNGLTRLLRNVYEAESTYMGGTKLECYQELLILFWKFLEENPLFMYHIINKCNINDIIVPICFLMYKSRRDPTQIGLVHICTFVLLKLSGERSFGVSLNKLFTKKLPTDLPLFHGCHTDLLVITLHKLVVNGAYKLVPLYSCFLTIISNISPYWKSMSLVAAVKLVNLFELFSSPKFLYSSEHAYKHLSLLLEVFNNIIQYQYHGNTHLVYAIVRRKDAFGIVAALTLDKAQTQCHKIYGDQITTTRNKDNTNVYRNNNNNSNNKLMSIENRAIPGLTNSNGGGGGNSNSNSNNNGMLMDDDEETTASQISSVADGGGTNNGRMSGTTGTNGLPFHPTMEWLKEVKENLVMETVARLLQHLVPVVDDIVATKQGIVDEQEILTILNEVTMVGLLPVPHPIVIRKYQPNQYTALWFTAFMWGVIFIRNQKPLPLFDGSCVELFQVALDDDDDDDDD